MNSNFCIVPLLIFLLYQSIAAIWIYDNNNIGINMKILKEKCLLFLLVLFFLFFFLFFR